MQSWLPLVLIAWLAIPVVADTPRQLPGLPNFGTVSPTLYRGAQPTAQGFSTLKAMGVKTIIDLRAFHSDARLLRGLGLQYVSIPSHAWHPETEDVVRFLQVVENPANQPVFVHCADGADRTGLMAAVYRIMDQHWSLKDATKELYNFHFHQAFFTVRQYLDHLNMTALRQATQSRPAPAVTTP